VNSVNASTKRIKVTLDEPKTSGGGRWG
jgi:hypothetical protein